MAVLVLGKQPSKATPSPTPTTPEALEEQALALQAKGDYAAAEGLFRKCLSERQRMPGG